MTPYWTENRRYSPGLNGLLIAGTTSPGVSSATLAVMSVVSLVSGWAPTESVWDHARPTPPESRIVARRARPSFTGRIRGGLVNSLRFINLPRRIRKSDAG